jgi:hypothetical protein
MNRGVAADETQGDALCQPCRGVHEILSERAMVQAA